MKKKFKNLKKHILRTIYSLRKSITFSMCKGNSREQYVGHVRNLRYGKHALSYKLCTYPAYDFFIQGWAAEFRRNSQYSCCLKVNIPLKTLDFRFCQGRPQKQCSKILLQQSVNLTFVDRLSNVINWRGSKSNSRINPQRKAIRLTQLNINFQRSLKMTNENQIFTSHRDLKAPFRSANFKKIEVHLMSGTSFLELPSQKKMLGDSYSKTAFGCHTKLWLGKFYKNSRKFGSVSLRQVWLRGEGQHFKMGYSTGKVIK